MSSVINDTSGMMQGKKMFDAESSFNLRRGLIQPEALQLISEAVARKYEIIPLEIKGNSLHIAMKDPTDINALEALSTISGLHIEPEKAGSKEIQDAIDFNYQSYGEIEKQLSSISIAPEIDDEQITTDEVADAPVAKAIMLIINEAIKARASDIHLQPEKDCLRVRYRVDGTLHEPFSLPLATSESIISRIKILAKMNIADHHRPQDGQFTVRLKGRQEVDIRVATIPIIHGEMAALRILDKTNALMTLDQLGLLPDSLKVYEQMLQVPYGMILVTGPTGSGKTTSLYASVNTLDKKGRNIITIEDPVEYQFENINQIQINSRAGLTFASGLRSILRLDPDVILVGEIRDAETANIAIQSALTGHLVLSSIHANDAVGVITRLLDLKIEPFLIASAVVGVVAQRMARRVDPDCARFIETSAVEQEAYFAETGEERKEFLYGAGCKSCAHTGYKGRIGLFEILPVRGQVRRLILENANAEQLRAQAVKEGMITLARDGMIKVRAGITTPAEVLHNAYTGD